LRNHEGVSFRTCVGGVSQRFEDSANGISLLFLLGHSFGLLDLFSEKRVCRGLRVSVGFYGFKAGRVKLQRRRKVTGGTAFSGLPVRVSVFRGE
jgi:hypothetical protein